jgi:hypothetical protein
MKRGVFHAARINQQAMTSAGFRFRAALITTTYADDQEWAPGDIRGLVRHYRQWAKRRGFVFRFVWVVEVKCRRSGARIGEPVPHYHLIAWLPRGITPPLPDKQGWWSKGMTNAKWARSPVGYIAKYASKGHPGLEIPFGAHLWGCGGLPLRGRLELRWHLLPMWVRDISPIDDAIDGCVYRRVRPPDHVGAWCTGWWRIGGFRIRSPWDFDLTSRRITWRGFCSDDFTAAETA